MHQVCHNHTPRHHVHTTARITPTHLHVSSRTYAHGVARTHAHRPAGWPQQLRTKRASCHSSYALKRVNPARHDALIGTMPFSCVPLIATVVARCLSSLRHLLMRWACTVPLFYPSSTGTGEQSPPHPSHTTCVYPSSTGAGRHPPPPPSPPLAHMLRRRQLTLLRGRRARMFQHWPEAALQRTAHATAHRHTGSRLRNTTVTTAHCHPGSTAVHCWRLPRAGTWARGGPRGGPVRPCASRVRVLARGVVCISG